MACVVVAVHVNGDEAPELKQKPQASVIVTKTLSAPCHDIQTFSFTTSTIILNDHLRFTLLLTECMAWSMPLSPLRKILTV